MSWLIVGIVIAVAAWFFLKRRKRGTPEPVETTPRPAAKPIWGKRIVIPPGATPCQAAQALAGIAFTLDRLPQLPLESCTCKMNCCCQFEPLTEKRNHKERRSGIERRPDVRFDPDKPQRRSGRDRRAENYNPFNEETGENEK